MILADSRSSLVESKRPGHVENRLAALSETPQ